MIPKIDNKVENCISDRISALLKEKKISQAELADWFSIRRQTISAIINKRSKLTLTQLIILKNHIPELNFDWILSGEGEMFFSSESAANPEVRNRIRELEKQTRDLIDHQKKILSMNEFLLKRIDVLEDLRRRKK